MPVSNTHLFEGIGNRQIRVVWTPSDFAGGIVVYTGRMFFLEEMCVSLKMKQLWEPGDTAQTLHAHFTLDHNFSIAIDGELLNNASENVYWESSLIEHLVFSESDKQEARQLIGSYSDLSYCFDTTSIQFGTHKARLKLHSLRGREYIYTWKFEVIEHASDR